ncbi:hypothetical protein TKK_0018989 [Trichogramma kaykai]|uniref:Uncharacterized protein n=1 Tax=Trichogramma kaykai TaxID=54128 RepID=A0ABD2VW28_9HYME
MEIMEDGNLLDRVRILLQRDMQYYEEQQTVLREPLCVRVSGGQFDFPRHASFAAVKMVMWWEAEFELVFVESSGLSPPKKDQQDSGELGDDDLEHVVKKVQPDEIISLIIETAEQLLEHLHKLIQESLDHADLTVLTATLGAAALIRNTIWLYHKAAKPQISEGVSEQLWKQYEIFSEMVETIADRLLDLHKRLISLYILNEAESLGWDSEEPFFEKKKCSFIYQMWWLYMKGTKTDLWNTVSPKTAQRIFSGMLNESLTIIVTRYLDARPSLERSMQFWADGLNVLSCSAYLALHCCVSGDEMIGVKLKRLSIFARDIQAKCGHLLVCFLLRGAPLRVLFQVFRNGIDDLAICNPRDGGPAPWLYVAAPHILGGSRSDVYKKIDDKQAAIVELNVLKAQPQPQWGQVIQVLDTAESVVGRLLMSILIRQCIGFTEIETSEPLKLRETNKHGKDADEEEPDTCGGFLCHGGTCTRELRLTAPMGLYALTYILIEANFEPINVFIPAVKEDPNWSNYVDKYQVWNQSRPPWLNALIVNILPAIKPIATAVLDSSKTGASMYQMMSLVLDLFDEIFECIPIGIFRIAIAIDENIPAHCRPIGNSVILQILCAALYTSLLEESKKYPLHPPNYDSKQPQQQSNDAKPLDPQDRGAMVLAIAEGLCAIDEADRHTAQIKSFVENVRKTIKENAENDHWRGSEKTRAFGNIRGDLVLCSDIGKRAMRIAYEYLLRTSDHLLKILKGQKVSDAKISALHPVKVPPLTHTMFHIGDEFPFDRLLHNYDSLPWELMFKIPLGIDTDRVRQEVLCRTELIVEKSKLPKHEREAASYLKQICTPEKRTIFDTDLE